MDTATGYASLTTLTINTLGLNWLNGDSPRSAFDPAGLGQPVRRISAWAELIYDTFPDTAAYYGRESLLAGRLRASMDLRTLSPESRLSAGLRLEGFTALGELLTGGELPGCLPTSAAPAGSPVIRSTTPGPTTWRWGCWSWRPTPSWSGPGRPAGTNGRGWA